MIKERLITAALSVAILTPTHLHAAGQQYVVELGTQPSAEAAQAKWDALLAEHQDLLGTLTYKPFTTIVDDVANTRVRAGTIVGEVEARRLCTKLFNLNVSCFVVEDKEPLPDTRTASLDALAPSSGQEQSSQPIAANRWINLPWLDEPQEAVITEPAPTPVEQKPEEKSFFSWLLGDEETKKEAIVDQVPYQQVVNAPPEAKEPAKEQDAGVLSWFGGWFARDQKDEELPSEQVISGAEEGKVAVAEAIRVPLTEGAQSELKELKPLALPAPELLAPLDQRGWLEAGVFTDEDTANGFWEEVRAVYSAETESLRSKTVKPLGSSGRSNVKLNIGPFADTQSAFDFCNKTLLEMNNTLNCKFLLGGVPKGALVSDIAQSEERDYLAHRAVSQGDAAPEEDMGISIVDTITEKPQN